MHAPVGASIYGSVVERLNATLLSVEIIFDLFIYHPSSVIVVVDVLHDQLSGQCLRLYSQHRSVYLLFGSYDCGDIIGIHVFAFYHVVIHNFYGQLLLPGVARAPSWMVIKQPISF